MSLTMIGAGGLFAGLALLAGAVFLLQRLRVRRDELIVPTTIFWQAALKESQARKLTERFRSPLVFLLLLSIIGLLWLALAGPRREARGQDSTLVLVDTSAGMGRLNAGGQSRLDAALERATSLLGELPASRRALLLVGEHSETLLAPNEPLELLTSRRSTHAISAPKGPATALAHFLGVLLEARSVRAPLAPLETPMPLSSGAWRGNNKTTVIVLAAPASLAGLKDLAKRDPKLTLELRPLPAGGTPNEGILAFGAAPAASADAQRADLFIETSGPTPTLRLSVPGAAPRRLDLEAQGTRFFVRDVPLTGGTVEASITGANGQDALAADDRATLLLPTIAPLEIAIKEGVDARWRAALEAVIAADSGLALAGLAGSTDADVRVLGTTDEPGSAGLTTPTLRLTGGPADGLTDTTLVGELRSLRAPGSPAFQPLFDSLALHELGTGLRAAGGPASTPASPPSRLALVEELRPGAAQLELPAALIAPPFELVETRSFPLLIGAALRWLAGRSEADAGLRELQSADLVGRAVTLEAPAGLAPTPARTSHPRGSGELWPALVLLAASLLVFEWYLTRTRRIP